jgi:hypothetical protein
MRPGAGNPWYAIDTRIDLIREVIGEPFILPTAAQGDGQARDRRSIPTYTPAAHHETVLNALGFWA